MCRNTTSKVAELASVFAIQKGRTGQDNTGQPQIIIHTAHGASNLNYLLLTGIVVMAHVQLLAVLFLCFCFIHYKLLRHAVC